MSPWSLVGQNKHVPAGEFEVSDLAQGADNR
jgi:hypothetical protein